VTKGILNAGIDAVSITSSGPGVKSGGGSNGKWGAGGGAGGKLAFAKARVNRRNGTVMLPVKVPAAGLISITGVKNHPKMVVATKRRLGGATTATFVVKPTAKAFRVLTEKHRLPVALAVRFNPNAGGASQVADRRVILQLAPRR
jgi:hypothetical protein